MKLNDREKQSMVLIGIVALAASFYFLGYKPLITQKDVIEQEVSALKGQLDQYASTLQSRIFYEEATPKLMQENAQIDDRLPQALPQELVIQTMDTLSQTLEMTLPNIGFTQVESVPLAIDPQTEEASSRGVLTGLKTGVTTATTCTYKELKTLLEYIRTLPMEVAIENMSMSAVEDKLAISFSMSLFGLEVPDRGTDPLSLGAYKAGKENMFQNEGAQASTRQEQMIYEDLFMIIDPVVSDNSAITMGKAKDSKRETYLYEETNAPSKVQIHFTQSGNDYYVKYQVGEHRYPEGEDKLILSPNGAFGIKVESTPRLYEDDQNEVQLTIHNETDKIAYIYVKNDDLEQPRFNLVKSTGDVRVKD